MAASVQYTAAQREMKLRSSKPKTYNTNVVRNCEIRLLVKGNFKRSIVHENLTKFVQNSSKREHEIKNFQPTKLRTDRLNGTVASRCIFFV